MDQDSWTVPNRRCGLCAVSGHISVTEQVHSVQLQSQTVTGPCTHRRCRRSAGHRGRLPLRLWPPPSRRPGCPCRPAARPSLRLTGCRTHCPCPAAGTQVPVARGSLSVCVRHHSTDPNQAVPLQRLTTVVHRELALYAEIGLIFECERSRSVEALANRVQLLHWHGQND